MRLIVYTDGGITADKKMCTAAFVACNEEGEPLASLSTTLVGTVPMAEYTGIGLAAKHLPEIIERYGVTEVDIFSDSELVVRQISGRYKTKDPALKAYRNRCVTVLNALNIPYHVSWVRGHNGTDGNELADYLCTYTKEHPPKTDLWAPIPTMTDEPSLGQLFLAGKLKRPRSMKVDAEGFGMCNRCLNRLVACSCTPLQAVQQAAVAAVGA